MSFTYASMAVSGVTLLVAWWLSRYDAKLIGDGCWPDKLRRAFRCLFTAALVEVIFWCFWRFSRERDAGSGLIPIPIFLVLAYVWAGAFSEIFSRVFGKLIESDGRQIFDERKGEEGLRQISQLAKEGRDDEALKLSEKLKKSGNTDIIVLEAMMERLGLDEKHADKNKSLAMARKLQGEGRFAEAARVLTGLLKSHPDHTEAAVLRIRIYAQDMGQGARAAEAFEVLQKQPGTSPGMIEFARSLLADAEPIAPQPPPAAAPSFEPAVESVDTLIAQRRFESAITALKAVLRAQPGDFASWSKLAEVYGRHCGSMLQVENIIKLLAGDSQFTPEQVQLLRTQLEDWRKEWKMARVPVTAPEQPQADTKVVL